MYIAVKCHISLPENRGLWEGATNSEELSCSLFISAVLDITLYKRDTASSPKITRGAYVAQGGKQISIHPTTSPPPPLQSSDKLSTLPISFIRIYSIHFSYLILFGGGVNLYYGEIF